LTVDGSNEWQRTPLAAKFMLAGCAVLAVSVLTAIASPRGLDNTVAIGSLAGLEALTDVQFPAGTTLVNARYSAPAASQGRSAWAVLEMPSEAARQLLTNSPFGDATSESRSMQDSYGHFFGHNIEGWHPDGAKSFLSASTVTRTLGEWDVAALANMDDEEAAIVYLYIVQ